MEYPAETALSSEISGSIIELNQAVKREKRRKGIIGPHLVYARYEIVLFQPGKCLV
jgi:hypothetical protein